MNNPYEPRDEDERELMDPESWDWESTMEGHTIGRPGAVLRVHFTRDEFLMLNKMARTRGLGPVEYTRVTMLRHIGADREKEGATDQRRPA